MIAPMFRRWGWLWELALYLAILGLARYIGGG
jgi:hypothetical protein